jgi:uncharacterized repeat protein (TIGR03943 family)
VVVAVILTMDERTEGALLLAVGGVSLRLGLTDAALAYVKAGLQPALVAAGIMLLLLGTHALVRVFRHTEEESDLDPYQLAVHEGEQEQHDDHGHAHGGPGVAWLLVLPLLALLLIAPPALGAFAAARQSTRPAVSTQASYPPLPDAENGAVPLNMSEYVFRGLYDPDESLRDVRVRLLGFVTPSEDPEDTYLLTRFTLNCCAADATAITVAVRGDQPRPADTWLEVEGEWEPRPGLEPGELSADPPLLVVQSARVVEAPSNPYEY